MPDAQEEEVQSIARHVSCALSGGDAGAKAGNGCCENAVPGTPRARAPTAIRRAAGGSLPSAFLGRRHGARSAANGVCHSNVRITPTAGIPAEKGPPRNWGAFPSPAVGGLCRPEVGVPSRPRAFSCPAGCAGGPDHGGFSRWGPRSARHPDCRGSGATALSQQPTRGPTLNLPVAAPCPRSRSRSRPQVDSGLADSDASAFSSLDEPLVEGQH